MIAVIDPADAASVGTRAASISTSWLVRQLVEAVEGTDFGTVIGARIAGPLGMESTGVVGPGWPAPPGMASGWNLDLGFVGDPATANRAIDFVDPFVSTADDLVTFYRALLEGRLVSEETLALMFAPDAEGLAYGFDQHEMLFGDLGDIGARYNLSGGTYENGHWGMVTLDPRGGDIVVALASNWIWYLPPLVRQIVLSWAEDRRQRQGRSRKRPPWTGRSTPKWRVRPGPHVREHHLGHLRDVAGGYGRLGSPSGDRGCGRHRGHRYHCSVGPSRPAPASGGGHAR